MTKIKGILIDVHERTIKEVEVERHDIHDIHKLVGCECFTCLDYNERGIETVYVDDEGLLKDPKEFFMIPAYPQWLAGNGLILGLDRQGNSVSTRLNIEQVKESVKFGRI